MSTLQYEWKLLLEKYILLFYEQLNQYSFIIVSASWWNRIEIEEFVKKDAKHSKKIKIENVVNFNITCREYSLNDEKWWR